MDKISKLEDKRNLTNDNEKIDKIRQQLPKNLILIDEKKLEDIVKRAIINAEKERSTKLTSDDYYPNNSDNNDILNEKKIEDYTISIKDFEKLVNNAGK